MMANSHRHSTYTTTSVGSGGEGKEKKDIWSNMLNTVASSKRLPQKNLLVLGGTVDSQRDFIESLSDQMRRNLERQNEDLPPIANSFALGCTYYDVLDADQDDILARITPYLISTPSPSFMSLVKMLLTPQTIPDALIVILLDWTQPWQWMRQLREWMLFMRTVVMSLDLDSKDAIENVRISWLDRGRTGSSINLDGTGAVPTDGEGSLPHGPGEWEETLGIPLCVVCQNSERIDYLEKSQGWKEEQFDLVLQFLRTVLLMHGASLIYTSPSMTSPLQSLIHASLGIHSLLKRESLKPNVIDRDKIVLPPNWDSWAKIRVLGEGLDLETVSAGWKNDIYQDFPRKAKTNGVNGNSYEIVDPDAPVNGHAETDEPEGSAVVMYEGKVQDTSLDALHLASTEQVTTKLEVQPVDTQVFLQTQVARLEAEKKADEQAGKDYASGPGPDDGLVDQIGPVQFNMGGIQVNADDMLQRLKDRQAYDRSPEPSMDDEDDEEARSVGEANMNTEHLAKFFGSLMNKRGK